MAQRSTTDTTSRENIALGVAIGAVVLYVLAMIVAQEENDWLWPLAGLVGAAAAIMGWTAGKPGPRGKALAAVVLGALVFVAIVGWIIWAAATGNFD